MSDTISFRYTKKQRLRKKADFSRIQSSKSRVHSAHFIFVFGPGLHSQHEPRLGVIVTRKIGCAVQRNRVKRLLREAFRLRLIVIPHGIDLLVIAKQGAPLLKLSEVCKEWSRVSTQIKSILNILCAAQVAILPKNA